MNFGKNLQILRKMSGMTQEELAEKTNVSRQTISKWELGSILPEIEKLFELGEMFHCTIDELLKGNFDYSHQLYSDIKIVSVAPFKYISYAVVSCEPEEDAIAHVERWAKHLRIENPYIIGWDFSHVSQEQRNKYHMRGYEAALLLDGNDKGDIDAVIKFQNRQNYVKITLKETAGGEFSVIPNAYKALKTYMSINGIKEKRDPAVLSCYEYEYYDTNNTKFMDVFIAIE
ncbi:MAG: helix-turn-helix domain-containing protein [Anaeroplasmataceae bacterium]|nr:helix-turn-helix domain-containing protein [Anaeroplasmataceae bacterium]